MTTLGAILRRRREAGEWSLADVARPAGISTAYLSEVERGQKDVSTERLVAVARALRMAVGDLYLELARELGARETAAPEAWETDARAHVRRMTEALDYDAVRTVARFTTFLAMSDGGPRRRPIGFLR
jgi:transcriptional regulator with XRE-family HTH domain